jgi:hypothetical protein
VQILGQLLLAVLDVGWQWNLKPTAGGNGLKILREKAHTTVAINIGGYAKRRTTKENPRVKPLTDFQNFKILSVVLGRTSRSNHFTFRLVSCCVERCNQFKPMRRNNQQFCRTAVESSSPACMC